MSPGCLSLRLGSDEESSALASAPSPNSLGPGMSVGISPANDRLITHCQRIWVSYEIFHNIEQFALTWGYIW